MRLLRNSSKRKWKVLLCRTEGVRLGDGWGGGGKIKDNVKLY